MREKMSGEQYRNFRLCIDGYEKGVPAGRIFNPAIAGGGCSFYGLTQLMVTVENILDETNFPQAFTARRSFFPMAEQEFGAAPENPESGKKGTFVIRIMFRQNTSWQGTVTWLDGNSEQTFRSVLELVLLMNNALGGLSE